MKKRSTYYLLTCFLLLLMGCMVGPKYSKRQPALPPGFSEPSNTDTLPLVQWFDLYQDPVLVSLIRQTLDNNRNMKEANSRVTEASLFAGVIKANLWPA